MSRDKNFVLPADPAKSKRKSTPEGQANSSDNSRTHGCTSRKTLLPGESPSAFKRLWQTWLTRYQAQDEFDLNRIEDAVNAEWRKRRSERTLNELEAKLYAEQPDPTRWTPDQNKQLQLFRRYYTADNNYFQKTLKLVESLKKAQKQATLTNHRIADALVATSLQPKPMQDRHNTALEILYRFPFPKPDPTEAGCNCPPCEAAHIIDTWRASVMAQPEPPAYNPAN